MIRLIKGPVPAVLAANAAVWTADFLAYIYNRQRAPDSVRGRYTHPEIKNALIEECGGKCAYCESKLRHVAPGDIDHIFPVSRRPDLIFEWSNLTLACPVCNRLKRDYYHPDEPLLDPYIEEPSEHLVFLGSILFARPLSQAGMRTILLLELNRPELMERRNEVITSLERLVAVWHGFPAGPSKDLVWQELQTLTSTQREYSHALSTALEALARA